MHRILVVEDEDNIRSLLTLNLELEGYEVVSTDDGQKALDMCNEQHFDLLVLDVMLPNVSGLEICEQIRLKNTDVAIIFLTAKDTSRDRIEGLKKGGDDYLTKPFELEELLLRVRNLLKRTKPAEDDVDDIVRFGSNEINFATYEAKGNPGSFTLTKKEALLLKLLISRQPEVVSRQQILQRVWGYDVYPSTRTIDNFILSFRKYFERDPANPEFFQSIRGVGYRFVDNEV